MDGAGGHHRDPISRPDPPVDNPDVGDDSAVGVVHRVEDHRSRRSIGLPHRRRDDVHDGLQEILDALARLRGDLVHIVRMAADDVREFRRVLFWLRGRQVDLVQHGNDLQVVLQR